MPSWSLGVALPAVRGNSVAVCDPSGRVYALGGDDNVGSQASAFRRSADGATWALVANIPETRVYPAACADSQGRVYFGGGTAGKGSGTPAGTTWWRYDPSTDNWAVLNSTSSLGTYGCAMVCDQQDRVYLAGGYYENQIGTDFRRFDPVANNWQVLASLPLPRAFMGNLVLDPSGRYIYAVGGYNTQQGTTDLQRYDTQTNTWTSLAPMNQARFEHVTAIDPQGRIYAIGGTSTGGVGTPLSSIERYSPTANAWTTLTPALPLARRYAFGCRDGQGRYLYMGGDSSPAGNGQRISRIDVDTENQAPNAATPTTPTTGSSVDRTTPITLAWVFNDPDAGDSQSKSDIRYKLTSASAWTTILGATTTATSYALPTNQAAGNYEWQVLTYDALGVASPWSSSSFFTAADPPGVPVITAPANGGTIATAQYTVTWSAPNQDAYEVRRVADNAGSPNTGTVYLTTGTVEDATSRARTLTFDTNNRTEHVQVRVRYSGIWSQWASVRAVVSYTPPATPVVVLTVQDATASILVSIANPTPSGSQPTVASHDILIDDGLGEGLTRRATGWPAGTPYTYWLSRSGRDYAGNIKVVAVATNSTTSTGTAT